MIHAYVQASQGREFIEAVGDWFEAHPVIETVAAIGALLALAWLSDVVARRYILRALKRIFERTPVDWDNIVYRAGVFTRLSHLVPVALVYLGITLVPGLPAGVVNVVRDLAMVLVVFIVMRSADGLINAAELIYKEFPFSRNRPIKGWLQILKIFLYITGALLIVAIVLGQSPLVLLGGFGAMTAVLMIVFKDTILSVVASIQIASNDMIRIGDWVEMPKYGADGDVVEIALHTVKIQNWDKTVTTIPTHAFITDWFRNWRYMSESGGRRIKRDLHIDQSTIRFLTEEEAERFKRFELLKSYIAEKEDLLEEANRPLAEMDGDPVNAHRLTNIGTLRAYILAYLRAHPSINQGMTLLVRQREPTPDGLPIQIYCFTATTRWAEYEGIQSDIFDHILAIVPEFGLRVFQHPSGQDIHEVGLAGVAAAAHG
jgi:miniconductance mechanosensitive channel